MNHTLDIKHLEQTSERSCCITMSLSDGLKAFFKYEAGQYITVHITDKENNSHSRCYSICNAPSNKDISICVKRVKNGIVSNYLLDELEVGDQLRVGEPTGDFTLQKSNALQKSNLVFITGGSGITPIKPMTEYLLETKYTGNIFLIYGNTDTQNIIFSDYFTNLETDQVKIIHTLDKAPERWLGEEGQLTISHLDFIFEKYNIPFEDTAFFMSGPPIIIKNATHCLTQKGVDSNNIITEKFYVAPKSIKGLGNSCETSMKVGNDYKLVKVKAGQTLLDAALIAGLDVEHSCKVGNCMDCVAKVKCGKVHSEIKLPGKENYILTCQSYPLDDTVEIDYTAKKHNSVLPSRNRLLFVSFFLALFVLLFAIHPENETYLAKGAFNTGHENLQCMDCHKSAPGTTRQQFQQNVKYYLGMSDSYANIGYEPVDNKVCLNCHERPNDRHPTHRFMEPRFDAARKMIKPEQCTSCHKEHHAKRVTMTNTDFCKHCHEDVEIHNDPLDVKHDFLIQTGQWNTCLQCHDFHGNHIFEVPEKMKDTIPQKMVKAYYEGEADPYGAVKEFIAKAKSKEPQKQLMRKQDLFGELYIFNLLDH